MNTDLIIWVLIGANAIASFKGFNDPAFFRKYEFHIGSIRAGEQYRMFTSAFLHVDLMHLVFNMLTLYFFAPAVIQFMGVPLFLLVYFGSLIMGNMLTLYMHKDEYYYRAVGASGAVMGVIYSAILFEPEAKIYLYYFIELPAYVFGIGYLLYTIYGMKAKNDNIGHTAHFGGAIGGYLITLIEAPHLFADNTLMVIILLIPIVVLFVMERMGKL